MANQIIVGHFEPDGDLIYLPLGFIPDFFMLCEVGTANPLFYWWWRRMQLDEASGSQEGVIDTGGVKTKSADDEGIVAYDSGSRAPTISTWTADTAMTAKTSTAHGTYIRPTTSSDMDRDAIFECVASSGDTKTHATTEPTWPAAIGEQVVDDLVTWERVNVPLLRAGYQGVRIAGNPQSNGQEMYYIAVQSDDAIDHGDVVGWTGGVYGA